MPVPGGSVAAAAAAKAAAAKEAAAAKTAAASNPFAGVTATPKAPSYANNSLPDGTYDYYNVGTMYDKTLYLGATSGNSEAASRSNAAGYAAPALPKVLTNQYATVENYAAEFASWSATNPAQFAAMQSELYAAGLYTGKPVYGVYTLADQKAMNSAMGGYLGVVNPKSPNPLTFSSYLDALGKQGGIQGVSGGGGGATRAPLQLTSSATLGQYSEQAGQSELGRNTTAAEQAAFTNKYHGEEQAQYNGAKEQAGAPDAEAKSFVDSNNQAEVQTHLQAGYTQAILNALGPSVGGA